MKLPVKVTNACGNIKLGAIKHSPEIAIGIGIAGFVATVVLACKETVKASDVIEEFKKDKEDVKQVMELYENDNLPEDIDYDERDYKHDIVVAHAKCAWSLFKCYAPAITVGALSIASILTGCKILKKRELAAIATTAALRESFNAYRSRVASKVGDEVEDRLFRGVEDRTVEVEKEDESGKIKKHKVRYEMATCGSVYSRIFDASNKEWEKSGMQNFDIVGRMRMLNSKLVSEKHLFLNDVYKALGFPISVKGQQAGWIYDENDPDNSLLKFTGIKDVYFTDQGGIAVDYMTMSDDWKALKNDWERDILIDFENIKDDILEDLPRVDGKIAIV
jgi:hypothetical protein